MSKSKTSVTRTNKRQRTDWKLFFRLCKEQKSNDEIAKTLGWNSDPKSADPYKRVRAAKSVARTRGVRVDGKLVRLHDRKLRGTGNPKPSRNKKAKPKSQPKPKHNNPGMAQKEIAVNASNSEQ